MSSHSFGTNKRTIGQQVARTAFRAGGEATLPINESQLATLIDGAIELYKSAEQPSGPFTIEAHGDAYALYSGRDATHHGFNLARISEATPEILRFIEAALNDKATNTAQPEELPTPQVDHRLETVTLSTEQWEELKLYSIHPDLAVALRDAADEAYLPEAFYDVQPSQAGHNRDSNPARMALETQKKNASDDGV